jgi:nucleoside-diphosphate-sugar epimerase
LPKRILFTGGTGKAGRHVLPWLLDQGYQILNFARQPFAHPTIATLVGDVTDRAQVFNAMTTHFGREGLKAGKAAETFRVNVMGPIISSKLQ